MKLMVGIGHPKGVHFWKNIIHNLESDGHEVKIAARKKDITLRLLDAYGLEYEVIGENYKGLIKKAYGMFECNFKAFKIAKEFKPDILASGAPYLTHVSKLIAKPHIGFSDTEHAGLTNWLSFPFEDVVMTPSCFKRKINPKKHIIFNGYFQLAYLHPNYFKPDPSVLDDLELSKDDRFIIIRLISWEATHDTNSKGFTQDFLETAVKSFEEQGHVYITSEQKLDKSLEKYSIPFSPEKLHSALYYANLHIGDGGSTAVEAALLGTPTVHFEGFKSKSGEIMDATHIHGIFDDLVNKYKILFTFADPNQAFNKALRILQDKNAKKNLKKRRERLLKEKIDVTAFMTDFIENYPDSFYTYQNKREHNYV